VCSAGEPYSSSALDHRSHVKSFYHSKEPKRTPGRVHWRVVSGRTRSALHTNLVPWLAGYLLNMWIPVDLPIVGRLPHTIKRVSGLNAWMDEKGTRRGDCVRGKWQGVQ
jgi:hypothetical protein